MAYMEIILPIGHTPNRHCSKRETFYLINLILSIVAMCITRVMFYVGKQETMAQFSRKFRVIVELVIFMNKGI